MGRARSLTNLCAAGGDPHASGCQLEPRPRFQVQLTAAREAGAVIEQRQTQRPVRPLVLLALALEVRAAHCLVEDHECAGILTQGLPCSSCVA